MPYVQLCNRERKSWQQRENAFPNERTCIRTYVRTHPHCIAFWKCSHSRSQLRRFCPHTHTHTYRHTQMKVWTLFVGRAAAAGQPSLKDVCLSVRPFVCLFVCRAPSLSSGYRYIRIIPTNPFTIVEPQNPSHDILELRKIWRSHDFEALKLWNGSSGFSILRIACWKTAVT